jgi:hypothetical protein
MSGYSDDLATVISNKRRLDKEEKYMSGHYEQLAAVVKPRYSNLNEPVCVDNFNYTKAMMPKEEKDMGEENVMTRVLDELIKAIKEDHKWANETSVIFENEMPDIYQTPEEKAFLNGVKFATRKYMDILKNNGVGGYENE